MAAVSTIMAATAVAGSAISAYGTYGQAGAQRRITQADIRAENAREKQMELENKRKQRDILRNAQVARANALAKTSSQGAAADGSSALPGVYGQIQTSAGQQILAQAENTQIGRELFAAARDKAKAQGQAATYQAISGLGQSISGNSQSIAQVGSTLFN